MNGHYEPDWYEIDDPLPPASPKSNGLVVAGKAVRVVNFNSDSTTPHIKDQCGIWLSFADEFLDQLENSHNSGRTTLNWQSFVDDDGWPDCPYTHDTWLGGPNYTRKCAVSEHNLGLYLTSPAAPPPPGGWAAEWDAATLLPVLSLEVVLHELGHGLSIQHHSMPPALGAVAGFQVTMAPGSAVNIYSPTPCSGLECQFLQKYSSGDWHCFMRSTYSSIIAAINGDQNLNGVPYEFGEYADPSWDTVPRLYRFCGPSSQAFCDPGLDSACTPEAALLPHFFIEAGNNCANQIAVSKGPDQWDGGGIPDGDF